MSYLANKHLEDTLGRPIIRHKPLNKGDEYPGLAKVFLEDAGMRPKVFVSEREPNKPFSSLMTNDIEGAAGNESIFISRPRNTDPLRPNYKLSTCRPSSALPSSRAQNEAAPVRVRPPSASPSMQRSSILSTADIEGAQPMRSTIKERTSLSLNTNDIEGASPAPHHSQPHFRPHVGLHPRDTNFNSKDINDYMVRRQRDLYQNESLRGKDKIDAEEMAASAQLKAQREVKLAFVRAQSQGLPSDFEYTGLPHFQDTPDVAAEDKRRQKDLHRPSSHAKDAEKLEKEQREELAIQEVVLDEARDSLKFRRDVRPAFSARSAQASLSASAREAADKAISALSADRGQVRKFWDALKRFDREGSGKCTIKELGLALDEAQINRTAQQMESLSRGLRDNAGLLAYNDLSKRLLNASKGLGSSPPPQYKLSRPQSAAPSSSPLSIQGHKVVRESPNLMGTPPSAPPPSSDPPKIPPSPLSPAPSAPPLEYQGGGLMMSSPNYDSFGEFRPSSSLCVRGAESKAADTTTASINSPPTRLWGTADEQKDASDAWLAKNDKTHAVATWHIHNKGTQVANNVPDSSSMSSLVSYDPRGLRDVSAFSTTSRNLKVGTLTGDELAAQLDKKEATRIGWRPMSAKPATSAQIPKQPPALLAFPPSGASLGSTFKPAPQPSGSKPYSVSSSSKARPSSARAALSHEMQMIRSLPAY